MTDYSALLRCLDGQPQFSVFERKKVLRHARELGEAGFWKFRPGSISEVAMARWQILDRLARRPGCGSKLQHRAHNA